MKTRRLIWLSLILTVWLILLAMPAMADTSAPPGDDVVIWNEDYTLESDKNLEGDLIVFGGDVTLEQGSYVEGSVIVWNGNAEIEGRVEEDLIVSGGDIYLGEHAVVEGNVLCNFNCNLERDEDARVDGDLIQGFPFDFRFTLSHPARFSRFWTTIPGRALSWSFRAIRTVATLLVLAAVGGLVALIWPQQTSRIKQTVIAEPGPSLGIGLLAAFAITVLIVVLALTICLAPVAILVALGLMAATLFGWIGIGLLVGERLMEALKVSSTDATSMWAAGLGTLVITLIITGLDTFLCLAPLGWLITIVLGSLGLGAVVLTRFGTMAYQASQQIGESASQRISESANRRVSE
ncbi:MAG TPA: hypothetical protein ENN19_03790 [Chloroflexi bacterium]|nr:hypothetical protein [Chloroflexota bacterium]